MLRSDNQSDFGVRRDFITWQSVSRKSPGWESRKVLQPPPTMNILSVDENPDYRHCMKESLLLNGYTVYAAENRLEACKILKATDIDLIISDMQVATFDGLTLRKFARETERYKHTKFILVSENKETYANILIRDPAVDFFFDKKAPMSEMVKFVDELMFGRYAGVWI